MEEEGRADTRRQTILFFGGLLFPFKENFLLDAGEMHFTDVEIGSCHFVGHEVEYLGADLYQILVSDCGVSVEVFVSHFGEKYPQFERSHEPTAELVVAEYQLIAVGFLNAQKLCRATGLEFIE